MPPKDKRAMIGTSVQLPAEVLHALAARWPARSVSDRIRLALERHEGIMRAASDRVGEFLGEHGDAAAKALANFGDGEWRAVMLTLPQIIKSESPALDGLAERLAVFDWVLAPDSQ